MGLSSRHLLGLDRTPKADIELILNTAVSFKEILSRPIKKVPTLQGKTIVNLFFENSTRTRISFELAERRLSADVVNFSASGSSVSKGETLKDTARNIEAMKIDMVVIRHNSAGTPHFLTRVVQSAVLNAGDGCHEHPTQGLLDMYTLKERFGSLDGLRVCIVGDISHSRVARSNIYGLRTMGAKVSVCGPATLIEAMMKVHQYSMLCASIISQEAAIEALVRGEDAMKKMRDQYHRRRDFIVRRFNEIGLKCHLPRGSFYAFPDISKTGMNEKDFAIGLLQALTQIQEMTLVFVPKIIAIFVVLLIALPFAGEAMGGLMTDIAQRIAAY